ncbi:MAG: hypothetical protein EOP51_03545 [Sphingobacteriales bacterium]|nr:MAG: hypothetical protein EOP51_03545 [Sphingobacteriales bacterium]
MKNYYELLGVTERATDSEIQIAYANMYQKCLLDKNIGGNMDEKLIDILVAYNALTNNKIKKEYNKVLKSDLNGVPDPCLDMPTIQTHGWLRSNIVGVVSVASLVAVFAYTAISINNYVQTKNESVAISKPIKGKPLVNEVQESKRQALDPIVPDANDHLIPAHIALVKHNNNGDLGKDKHVSKPHPIINNSQILLTVSPEINTVNEAANTDVHQGSVKGEVLKMRGTPNAIVRFDNATEIWCYSNEKISFTNGIATSIQQN